MPSAIQNLWCLIWLLFKSVTVLFRWMVGNIIFIISATNLLYDCSLSILFVSLDIIFPPFLSPYKFFHLDILRLGLPTLRFRRLTVIDRLAILDNIALVWLENRHHILCTKLLQLSENNRIWNFNFQRLTCVITNTIYDQAYS